MSLNLQRYQGAFGLVLLLIAAYALEPRTFFSAANFANLLNQLAVPGTLAVGMTFVILTGGIDLSVGSLIGLLNCVIATWITTGAGVGPTIGYALLIGTLIGMLTGLVVDKSRLQPFIVTLAAMVSLRGIAFIYTNRGTVSGFRGELDFLTARHFGLPLSAWIMICLTVAAGLVLTKTVFGRSLYVLGGNAEAAKLAGLNLTRLRMGAYGINGFCVAIAALAFTARNANGDPSAGAGYELDAITAVVIGGTSLMGGIGGVTGTFFGGLFIVCLDVLFWLRGVDSNVGKGIKGVIILAAVYVQSLNRNRS